MNTNLNNESGNPDFDYLFTHDSEKEELQSKTRLLSFRFLSELEKYSDKSKGLKKRLAVLINRSPSYVTQLFNGDKIINLETVAKFENALGIEFKIAAYPTRANIYSVSSSTTEKTTKSYLPNIPEKSHFIEMHKKLIEANSERLDYAQDSKTPSVVKANNIAA